MRLSVDQVKGLNIVELLSRHYGLKFKNRGGQQVSLSPFSEESEPSFFVRKVSGHWLFKDYSSGSGGSIIDFVLLKEGFTEVSEALNHIHMLLGSEELSQSCEEVENAQSRMQSNYDIKQIYEEVCKNNREVCCEYLLRRGISQELIKDVIEKDILVHNQHQGHSYCSFAVFDARGGLNCLDNHGIDTEKKFVLGRKEVFSLDWGVLSSCEEVFISEGIIDYLSIKTLEGRSYRGLALLGNSVRFGSEVIRNTKRIVSALDSDAGGVSGLLELEEKFPEKELIVYNLGNCKDPNEYLQKSKAGKCTRNLRAQDKVCIYREFISTANKSSVASKWGINRSYMYQIVKECEELIFEGFSQRNPGRKPANSPGSLEEAIARIAELEEEKSQESLAKERYYARSEFMKIRLNWAEAAQLQGASCGQVKKRQIKKKRS
jgi:DNA primase